MFTLEKRESPRAKHLPSEPAELPVVDELGIAKGGVRLPPVEVPTVRYVSVNGGAPKAVPLDKAELTRRYGTPENYRKKGRRGGGPAHSATGSCPSRRGRSTSPMPRSWTSAAHRTGHRKPRR